jgi:hypothetical protein
MRAVLSSVNRGRLEQVDHAMELARQAAWSHNDRVSVGFIMSTAVGDLECANPKMIEVWAEATRKHGSL